MDNRYDIAEKLTRMVYYIPQVNKSGEGIDWDSLILGVNRDADKAILNECLIRRRNRQKSVNICRV